jgi:hypothetical protein
MKRMVSVVVGATVLVALAGAALAFMGPRGMGMGAGMMGGGMMGMSGAGGMGGGMGMMGNCPGMAQAATATQVTEEKAKMLAQEYADKYLKGFTVDKVLPFTGPRHTMYSVELKGPNDEIRVLHVNPWGNVMPFGGPGRRPA